MGEETCSEDTRRSLLGRKFGLSPLFCKALLDFESSSHFRLWETSCLTPFGMGAASGRNVSEREYRSEDAVLLGDDAMPGVRRWRCAMVSKYCGMTPLQELDIRHSATTETRDKKR